MTEESKYEQDLIQTLDDTAGETINALVIETADKYQINIFRASNVVKSACLKYVEQLFSGGARS